MEIKDFKNIVGEAKEGEVATIRFFGLITEDMTNQFNREFDYLETCVRPKLIKILINSEGGSVLHGMTSYSTIQNSKIPTECIIEGMAASMASIIWAAGDRSVMRDYSILMIHNPFLPSNPDASSSDLVLAFIKQIKTIYRKRFGLKVEHIESIMKGEAGKDGTFFDAGQAVKAGIIPPENVLHTSKQLIEKVKNELSILTEASDIQSMMSRISMEAETLNIENKPNDESSTNLNKIQKQNKMDTNEQKTPSSEYAAVAATLGLKDNYEVKDVMARISELMGVEAKLTETQKDLKDAQTVIAGRDATILNLQKDKDNLTATVKTYQDKEADEQKVRIEQLVEAAITEGKIENESKDKWIEMAQSNYSLAEGILASIPVREQISKEISKDPENVQAAANAAKTVEEKMADKVQSVVGKDFEFQSLK